MKKFIKELIPYVIILVVVILIRSFIATPVIVNGSSMSKTLEDGQVLILNKIHYHLHDIKRFDIVVIDESFYESNEKLIIKRIIGLPGETVRYDDNNLYINGKQIDDKYARGNTYDFDLKSICDCQVIPEDKYLVLGDNREVSKDSRIIGLVDKKDIEGRTKIRLFPFTKIRIVK